MLIAGLSVVGGWLIVTGILHWLEERAARNAVHGFLTAVREGDRDTVLFHLTQQRREAVEEADGPESAAGLFQRPTPGFRWQIRDVVIEGNSATAALWIEQDRVVLEPVVHLVRTNALTWKIDRFGDVHGAPHGDDLQQTHLKHKDQDEQHQDERTAAELKRHFESRPGISVRRVSGKASRESATTKR